MLHRKTPEDVRKVASEAISSFQLRPALLWEVVTKEYIFQRWSRSRPRPGIPHSVDFKNQIWRFFEISAQAEVAGKRCRT